MAKRNKYFYGAFVPLKNLTIQDLVECYNFEAQRRLSPKKRKNITKWTKSKKELVKQIEALHRLPQRQITS